MAPPLVPVRKTEPLILNENEAPWAVQEYACVRQRSSFLQRLLSFAVRNKPSGLCSANHCGPMKLDMPTEC